MSDQTKKSIFQVGDIVEFEMRPGDRPRWSFDDDGGSLSPAVWRSGVVTSIDVGSITTHYWDEEGKRVMWCWPLEGHRYYFPGQWDYPGYLRHKRLSEPVVDQFKRGCVHCYAEALISSGADIWEEIAIEAINIYDAVEQALKEDAAKNNS